jgi:hypothetical protein
MRAVKARNKAYGLSMQVQSTGSAGGGDGGGGSGSSGGSFGQFGDRALLVLAGVERERLPATVLLLAVLARNAKYLLVGLSPVERWSEIGRRGKRLDKRAAVYSRLTADEHNIPMLLITEPCRMLQGKLHR